jgi:hypothetical protein
MQRIKEWLFKTNLTVLDRFYIGFILLVLMFLARKFGITN